MNKTRFQKVNRAAVASVLAASGTVAVLPISDVKAASPFTDLNPSHFAYDAIINLYERNIISGYGNGKFGPNDSVTRGQAAKMLAQVLELDTTSVVNPNFKDVTRADPFYKYIAALANAGVINGFVDQTYRANEPITRGQMATILTRGFQFKPSEILNHPFDDVSERTFERYFIQTIYDLGITNGKGKNEFVPYGSVTRGELAVFINRAENVEASPNPSYLVTDVHEVNNITYAYINGIKHTVDSRMKAVFNEENAEALEGAIIKGEISDTKRILDIETITFTASGTKARPLQFNGKNKIFSGDVNIAGSYIKFRDWIVTGNVTIDEKTESLVHAKRNHTVLPTIASIGPFSFIDWGTETDPDNDGIGNAGGNNSPDGPADGSEDGTGLVSPPSGNVQGYSAKMSPVNRHIEFIDCDIRYLTIKVAGTHITSNNVLPNVTISDKAKTVELYADIETLYMQADTNTTIYGVSQIEQMYKNSVKSVTLDADTTIDLLVVDNSNGWIDLGEYTYIHKVIIPPGKMPNDIFNDFINDNDLIGDIEDPSGEDVDRDPIENTIVPDLEDPVLTIVDVEVDGTTAKATFQSNEDGEIYYLVRKKNDDIPSIKTIMESQSTKWGGKIRASEMTDVIAQIRDLDDRSEYILYAVSMDEAGNISDKVEQEFRVTDATPPVVNITKAEAIGGKNSAEIEFKINEEGAIHYLIRPADEDPPTLADVKRLGKTIVVKDFSQTYRVRELGLEEYTDYVVYAIGEDALKNLSKSVVSRTFETGEADYERPYLLNPQLDQDRDVKNWDGEEGRTQVTLKFSEPLDAETAENVKNYVLSGTGNLTGNPYKAELSRNGDEVVLTIPSMAAFVDNDTLVITIDKVTDLAGNEILPKSKAVLEFTVNRAVPIIKDIRVSRPKTVTGNANAETKDVTFHANVPGRYYYLILPIEDGLEKVRVEDVIFPEQYLNRNKSIIKYHLPDKGNVGGVIQAPGDNMIQNIQYDLTKIKAHEKGYKIYMVMQNRDGKYSENVAEAIFIDDMQFPKIVASTFVESVANTALPTTTTDFAKIEAQLTTPASADTAFRFDVDANGEYLGEKYFRYAIRFSENMNRTAAETLANYTLAGVAGSKLSVAKATLLSDGKTVLLDLQATGDSGYEEYNLIHNDQLRIELSRNIVDSSGLGVGGRYGADGTIEYPSPASTREFTYVDKVKPKLKYTRGILFNRTNSITSTPPTADFHNKIYEYSGGLRLEFTFTENIETTRTTLDVAFVNDFITQSSTASLEATNLTVDKNKLLLDLNVNNLSDLQLFKFNFSNAVADKQSNIITTADASSFNGFYRFRAMPLAITGIQLVRPFSIPNGPNNWNYYSTEFEVTGLMKYYANQVEDEIKLYYAVSTQALTADQIINPQNYTFSTIFGEGLVNDITFKKEFTTSSERPFQNDQVIYFVLTDGYGNVSEVISRTIPKPVTNSN